MFRIFKYLKKEWLPVSVIIVLLVIQASCDLALPQYTSDIINTGISKYGIEYAVPEAITSDTYNAAELFLDSNQIEELGKYYEKTDKYSQEAYVLTDKSKAAEKSINDLLREPLMAVFSLKSAGEYDPQAFSMMPLENRMEMLEKIKEKVLVMGESSIDTVAAKTIIAEKEALGINKNTQQTEYMVNVGAKMLGVSLLAMICMILVGLLASRIGARVGMNLRVNVFKNVVGFSNAEMDKFSTASLITRSTNDIQQVQMVTVLLLRMVLYAPIIGIGGIIKVIRTESSMAWIIAVAVGVIMSMILVLIVIAMPKFKKMQELVDGVNLVAREILTGLPVIRAFSREKHEEARFEVSNKKLMSTQLFTGNVMSFMMPFMMFIMNGVSVMIIWFGGKGIDAGKLQVGDMMAFITYAMQIIIAFLMLTAISIILPRAGVAAGRIDEVIATKGSITDPVQPAKHTGNGEVKFNNVEFSYSEDSEDVLENISFTAEPGKTTAIIGSTGCGKSTLVNLIPRLYDVSNGSITIDGIDIRNMSQRDLREMIGYVPQKAVLFSGTIDSNLRFGSEDATAEEIAEAAEIAQAADFINEKTEKYESEISQGGSNVSGGQKQRLSIARAIAKKPKIFIFDDSFSALDYKTDIVLRQALREKTGDSTVIIVAQRISTILNADQIIVLEEGRIAGVGTHAELLKNNEVYRQIAMSQLSEDDIEMIGNAQEDSNEESQGREVQ